MPHPPTADFFTEIWSSLRFFVDYALNKPNTHSAKHTDDLHRLPHGTRPTFAGAFGLDDEARIRRIAPIDSSVPVVYEQLGGSGENVHDHGYDPGTIPMHPVAHHDDLNSDELDYRASPRQVRYD
jgi:hypothetical protein